MQHRVSFTFLPIYLTALVALLTWTSLAQGAAINLDSSPSRRDLAEGAGAFGTDISYDDILGRDNIASAINADGPSNAVGYQRTLALGEPSTGNDDVEIVDDNVDLSRRWYTLVEIAEAPESE